mmetsp:Transcript_14725/g.44189  ORF Transcript_14725/g.44189 Transcript_14725/m.44189 type:complete len:253 (-) Transcript_14725:235-993(-)
MALRYFVRWRPPRRTARSLALAWSFPTSESEEAEPVCEAELSLDGLPGGGLAPKAAPKAAEPDAAPSALPASKTSAGSFGVQAGISGVLARESDRNTCRPRPHSEGGVRVPEVAVLPEFRAEFGAEFGFFTAASLREGKEATASAGTWPQRAAARRFAFALAEPATVSSADRARSFRSGGLQGTAPGATKYVGAALESRCQAMAASTGRDATRVLKARLSMRLFSGCGEAALAASGWRLCRGPRDADLDGPR